MFRDRPSNIVEDATESSSQISEIRVGLVKMYIKDHANIINVKKPELEQYLKKS